MQILKALPVVAALAVAFGLGACANKANLEVAGDDGVAVSVAPFDKVELSGSGVMTFAQKPGPVSVKADIPERIRKNVGIEVKGGTLRVWFKESTKLKAGERVAVSVTAPKLTRLDASGAWSFNVDGKLDSPSLDISTSGSCNVSGSRFECTDLRLKQRGACKVSLSEVRAGDIAVEASGSCKAAFGMVESAAARFDAKGACKAAVGELRVQTLAVAVSGACKADFAKAEAATANVRAGGSCSVGMPVLKASGVEVVANGKCDIKLAGKAGSVSARATGASDIDVEGLVADSVSAVARGNSSIACNARKMLSVAYSGASKIGYKGNPRIEMDGKRGLYRIGE